MHRFKILCVDDDESVRDLLRRTFSSYYDLALVSCGDDALEVLRDGGVDLLITDQRMPKMRGTELIEHAHRIDPDLLVILLTAFTETADLIEVINRSQVYRFVTKPWELHDLTQTVRSALEQVELVRANRRLNEESQRRLGALELLHDVARGVSSAQSYGQFVDTLLGRIADIVAVDVVASLTRENTGAAAAMTIRCLHPVPESALEVVQEALTTGFSELTGTLLSESDVFTKVSGRTTGCARSDTGRLGNLRMFPLQTDGRAHGLIAVGTKRVDAINQDDERILEIVATQTGEVLGALTTRLELERARTQTLVDHLEEGLVVTNPRGRVVLSNRAARRLLGLGLSAELGSAYFLDRLRIEPFEIVRNLELSGPTPTHKTVETASGSLSINVHPILDGGGGLERVVYRLKPAADSPHRDAFLSFVSHELRTPLTSVHGTLDLLLDGRLGELSSEQVRYVRLARDASLNLTAFLNDLIEGSVADGRIELKLELASVSDIVSQSAYRFEAAMRRQNIELDLDIPKSPIRGLVDPARLQQVLNNMLTNALKFTSSDGVVTLNVFSDSESCGFTVRNSGAPLDDEELASIFDPYRKGASLRGYHGTGLGLSIARSIVEGHGGHIWAESDDGGVCFVVVLPLQGLLEREWARGFKIGSVQEIASAERAPRILLVDSDRATAFALKGSLLSRGYIVDLAHDADNALQRARDAKPELLIVDADLEGLGGIELMHIFRHDPDTQTLPMLALCAPEVGLQVSRAGADAHLPKPLEGVAFIATVQRLISGAREGRRVLVVDDDPEFRATCAKALSSLGFLIGEAYDGESALERALSFRPDLILLDVNIPGRDGFELFRDFKSETTTEHAAVIFVSGRTSTEEKVRALRMGGDDFLVKPFEPAELGARAEMVLRRRDDESASSPTTRLPGGVAIGREISRRLESSEPFCLVYIDLDDLKAFNDHYGYAKADGVIRQTGDLLREVVGRAGSKGDFLGHIAGDDFVLITVPGCVDEVCEEVLEGFDRVIPLYYTRKDRQQGYIEAEDRYGHIRKFSIMGVSIAAVIVDGQYCSHSEVSMAAAELKKRAKAIQGSCYLRDDRFSTSDKTAS